MTITVDRRLHDCRPIPLPLFKVTSLQPFIAFHSVPRIERVTAETENKEGAMLRVLAVAAMLAVAMPSLAMAEEHHDHHGGPPHPGGPPIRPVRRTRQPVRPTDIQVRWYIPVLRQGAMVHPGPVPGAMGGPHPGFAALSDGGPASRRPEPDAPFYLSRP